MGLLFDQKFGLLVYAPLYVLTAVGAWQLLREPRWKTQTAAPLALAILYAAACAQLYIWWGGSSAPARFLVPIVPLLAELATHVRAQVEKRPRRDVRAGEALSERELDVLRLLASDLSLREVAGELYVSLNTVKTHARAIYRKLDATSRKRAVERARELELLQD